METLDSPGYNMYIIREGTPLRKLSTRWYNKNFKPVEDLLLLAQDGFTGETIHPELSSV